MKKINKANKIYMAYGSNLHLEQMKVRCPYAVPLGTAKLSDYMLMFCGDRNNAVATVKPEKGHYVPVLLWEITPRDEEALDRYEGWPRLYRKETLSVTFEDQPVDAMIYIMNDRYTVGLPNNYYLSIILEGYKSAGFDTLVLEKAVKFSEAIDRIGR